MFQNSSSLSSAAIFSLSRSSSHAAAVGGDSCSTFCFCCCCCYCCCYSFCFFLLSLFGFLLFFCYFFLLRYVLAGCAALVAQFTSYAGATYGPEYISQNVTETIYIYDRFVKVRANNCFTNLYYDPHTVFSRFLFSTIFFLLNNIRLISIKLQIAETVFWLTFQFVVPSPSIAR
jgi:hypothetical protein